MPEVIAEDLGLNGLFGTLEGQKGSKNGDISDSSDPFGGWAEGAGESKYGNVDVREGGIPVRIALEAP